MSIPNTKDFFDFIVQTASENYAKNHSHVPMFIIDFKEPTKFGDGPLVGMAVVPAFGWETEHDRSMMAVSMKMICKTGNVNHIAFIHEMYMVSGTEPEVLNTAPRDNPNHISVLWLVLESESGARHIGYFPIKNPDTKRAALEDFKDMSNDKEMKWAGRFANFFGERTMQ